MGRELTMKSRPDARIWTGFHVYYPYIFILVLSFFFQSCSSEPEEPLPIIGTIEVPYTFTNQDGKSILQADLEGTIYVADFFFTSCPTICPIMKTQMLRVYNAFTENDNLLLLSHTIDPEHDTVAVLHDYAQRLEIETDRWLMVTGPKSQIYDTAERYMMAAMEDKQAPGGFIHSGSFCLVDQHGRIRGYYRGTEEESVDQLISDIKRLMNEA